MNTCELITSIPQFVAIPQNEDDPRNPPEIINLHNIDVIQVVSEDKLVLDFANGKIKTLTGDRAKSLINDLVKK